METYQSRAKIKMIATVVAIIGVIGVVGVIEILQHQPSDDTASTPPVSTTAPATTGSTSTSTGTPATSGSSTSSASASSYKDGTYTADAQYYVPHGYEDIKVTLIVANGVVTNSSIVNSENSRDSATYQQVFAAEYKSKVVGKSLNSINLSYVAGASDTTQGFNDAVSQIQSQAKA